MSKTFVGARLRQLRTERGLSQAALAKTLDISASYLNQIEHDVRPLTVPVLLRISEVFGVDTTFFSSQDDTRLIAELREVALDKDMGIDADAQEIAEMVSSHPGLAKAMVNMHRRFRNTSAQLAAATEDRFSDGSGSGSITMPHEEVRDYFYQRQNYIHDLDTAAEDLTARLRFHRGDIADGIARRLENLHDVQIVRRIDLGENVLHRYDPETRVLEISPRCRVGSRCSSSRPSSPTSSAAICSAGWWTRATSPPTRPARSRCSASPTTSRRPRCCRTAVPRDRGGLPVRHRAAVGVLRDQLRDDLSPAVDAAAPEAAGRAVVVRPSRPRRQHVEASVRHRFPLLVQRRHVPAVERVRDVRVPGKIMTQIAQMPDGRNYLWVARTVERRAQRYGQPGKTFAIGLGCELRHAPRVVYADGLDLGGSTATPIGAGCRVCERMNCPQRAFPPLGKELDINEHRSSVSPYTIL